MAMRASSVAEMGRAPSLVIKEKKADGAVKGHVFREYFGAAFTSSPLIGIGMFAAVVVVFVFAQVLRVYVDVALAEWTNSNSHKHSRQWDVYAALVFGSSVVMASRVWALTVVSTRASTNIHNTVFRCVLHASVPNFFDVTTIGTVINRFSKDMDAIDLQLPDFINMLVQNFLYVLSTIVLCVVASYWFSVLLVPLLGMFVFVHSRFRSCSRELKRIESASRTPLFNSFSETLNGLESIRAFGHTDRFVRNHMNHVNNSTRMFEAYWMCSIWLLVRCELIADAIVFITAIAIVLLGQGAGASTNAIALVWVLQLTGLFQRTVQVAIDVESYMTSAERVLQYKTVPPEADSHTPRDLELPVAWPQGTIQFQNVVMRYRGGDPVLKQISFTIEAGKRVGICGRTGAGKSSLSVALFRMVEIDSGSISIDGIDILSLGLTKLRSSLSIVPQDPVLFSGSVRFNLDPFNEHSDEQLWSVLARVEMTEKVKSLPAELLEPVVEMGNNFSQGQRQLICIARALLKDARILIMDEATSSIDSRTDELIQRTLRSLGRHVTLMTIAHRLQTILDYDEVMVLSEGKVVEKGAPSVLMQTEESLFSQMVKDSTGSDD
eukprot:c5888_g1_i2.p1 GENE.c5888_g1_i2~~c5888_g1_i2.p1  ORF type:complete len:672 (-),score=202.77 c5888_g1_i2:614-2434(-)